MMDHLEFFSPGLTKYKDANGKFHDLKIREEFVKKMENERKRIRLMKNITLGKH
jgi:hypothetical protein